MARRLLQALRAARSHPSRLAIPLAAVVLAILGGAVINALVARANSSREHQLSVALIQDQLDTLQSEPLTQGHGVSPAMVRASMHGADTVVATEFSGLEAAAATPELRRAADAAGAYVSALGSERRALDSSDPERAPGIERRAAGLLSLTTRRLVGVDGAYRQAANAAVIETRIGSAIVIALLMAAFLFFYMRASAARSLNHELLEQTLREAQTDALTGLGNRRALFTELTSRVTRTGPLQGVSMAVILLDLDGFKPFNDTFGHPAGDRLLARLGRRLSAMTGPAVTAFRMGGDEFCVVANVPQGGALAIAERAAQALSESGTGYSIRCSFGLALYPSEAGDGIEALGIADERLYEHKDARALSGDRIPEPVRMR